MINEKRILKLANELGQASNCVSKKVGCFITTSKEQGFRFLSSGYNGSPPKFENCPEICAEKTRQEHHEWSLNYEVHAEMNAILWAARKGISLENAVCFVNLEPCFNCVKHLIAVGVEEIVFLKEYDMITVEERKMIRQFIKSNNIKLRYIINTE